MARANAPFRDRTFARPDDESENRRLKHLAPKWLSWVDFFAAWYRAPDQSLGEDDLPLAKGMDVDHPLVRLGTVSVKKIALDFAHLCAWQLVDEQFDQVAYLSVGEVFKLRKESSSPDKRPLSLSMIGRQLGVSAEAVRETVAYGMNPEAPKRRDRLLPGGLNRISRTLKFG